MISYLLYSEIAVRGLYDLYSALLYFVVEFGGGGDHGLHDPGFDNEGFF